VKKPVLREEPAKWRGKAAAGAKPSRKARKPPPPPASEDLGSSTITAKGQTTIPKKVRDRLGLRPGSRLDFELLADGTVRLRGASVSLLSLYGYFGKPKRKATIEEMNQIIRRRWAGLR
jgi:AbrB family looped-hinge helix DNA binding protein